MELRGRPRICNIRSAKSWETVLLVSSFRRSSLHLTRTLLSSESFKTSDSRYAFVLERVNVAVLPCSLQIPQNRELQIMRIVRHPNIVQLKAFYYSNGERVRSQPL